MISIRKFPFPYRSALTICNDIDGTSFDDFITIHSFLNTNQDTILGKGLELELADSFWFYSNKNTPDNAFSYFNPDLKTESQYAPIIRELIHTGYIDTLHTYGNFSCYGGFTRSFAERCFEEIEKHNLDLEIWVNHGDEHNTQNIGVKKGWPGSKPFIYTNGFKTKNPSFHLDLLLSAGFKYFWDTETSLTKIIGQERDCYWHEKFIKNSLSLSPADKIKSLMRATAEVINQTSKKYLKRNLLKTAFEDSFDNKLFRYEQFDDTSFMLKFCRFGSGRYDWSEDLAFLLRDRVLLDLISSEGFCILYVHWGDRKDKNNPLPFSRDTIEVFCNLANKYHNGYIWVSTKKKS